MNFKDRLKKHGVKVSLALIILGAALFSLKWYLAKSQTKNKTAATVIKVKRGDILLSVSVTGTIQPLQVVEVKSTASGKIIKMRVERGDYLKAGQLIAEIEKTFTQPEVEQSEADLRSAKARLEQAKINIELQKKQSEAEIASREEGVKTARTELVKLQEQIASEHDVNERLVADAKNNLEIAKLKLNILKLGSRPEEVKRAEATLAQAKSTLVLNQKQLERLTKLSESGYVSKEDMETAQAKVADAQSQHEAATQNLELVKNPSTKEDFDLAQLQVKQSEYALQAAQEKVQAESIRQNDVAIAQGRLKDAEAALELALANQSQIEIRKKDLEANAAQVVRAEVSLKAAQDRLKDTLVTAPISGTILQKFVEEGQVIASGISAVNGGTTLVTMADLNKVYINANIDETDIGKIMLGQKVRINVDAFPKEKFLGTIMRIAPLGEVVQNVTTFEVTIEIANPSAILKPGMNAGLEIVAADRKNVLYVPNDSLKEKHGDVKEVSVLRGGTPTIVEVKTGVANWEYTEIISGLAEEEVVTKALNNKKMTAAPASGPRPPGLFGH